MDKIPESHNRALRRVNWTPVIVNYILEFLKGNTKQTPRFVRKYGGKEKFKEKNGHLFVYGRRVIITDQERKKILDEEEEKYGGQRKAADRLNRKYFGITRKHVTQYFSGSERRQLKARQQKTQKTESYIHATRPGTLQVDLTFYRGSKIPVFGAVDVFSRYAYYERVPNKRADFVVKAMKNCIAHFDKILNKDRKIHKVSSDAGVEFQAEFKAYLKNQKIFYDKKVRARKMIESLNRTLRRYVERVGWDTLKELDELIEQFVHDYNRTKHTTTKKVPIDLINIPLVDEKAESKAQHKAGKKRMRKTGYKIAELKVGDKVRIYDPGRKEIKDEQKKKLKGKIKLSDKDYVKQYTSSHRGNEPHWTREVFTIERVTKGQRARRYFIEGKKGTFMRSELQKVAEVKKVDPRVAKKKKAEEEKQKLIDRRPPTIRASKYVNKFVFFKHETVDRQRGLCIDAVEFEKENYYLLVVSRQHIYLIPKDGVLQLTNKKHSGKEDRIKYAAQITEAKESAKKFLSGESKSLKTKFG